MRPHLRDARRAAVLLAALALTAAACAKPDDPDVGVSALNADIVFGVAEPLKPVAPAGVGSSGSISPEQGAADEFIGEEILDIPSQPKNFPRPPLRAAKGSACPPAAANAFPDREATLNVYPPETLPQVGLYKWKKEGTQTSPDGKTVTPITGLQERLVRKVQVAEKTASRIRYTFQTVQPSLGGGSLIETSYFVDSAATSAEQNSPINDARVVAGAPERGLVIRGFRQLDTRGEVQGSVNFAAGGGLLVAPLPIRTGERFASVAVDNRTGQSYRFEGQMVRRVQVDACGEVIAGWFVDGTLTTSAGAGNFDLVIAPQFGAIPLQEVLESTDAGGFKTKVTYTIGQRDPSPLPADGNS